MASASLTRWVRTGGLGLLVAGLVNGGALGNAVIVALPDDVGVYGEGEHALDRFSVGRVLVLLLGLDLHPINSNIQGHT